MPENWHIISKKNNKKNNNNNNKLFTSVLSQWDFSYGKVGLPSPGKAIYDTVALPNLGCMLGVLVFP